MKVQTRFRLTYLILPQDETRSDYCKGPDWIALDFDFYLNSRWDLIRPLRGPNSISHDIFILPQDEIWSDYCKGPNWIVLDMFYITSGWDLIWPLRRVRLDRAWLKFLYYHRLRLPQTNLKGQTRSRLTYILSYSRLRLEQSIAKVQTRIWLTYIFYLTILRLDQSIAKVHTRMRLTYIFI